MTEETLLKEDIQGKMKEILSHYNGERHEMIPILQETQAAFRYLPETAVREISRFLNISEATIYGVSTFYAQFRLKPIGKNIIRVCRGTACHVRGAGKILAEMEKRLGIKTGETTRDMEYTLETVACIGACALAPTMTIENETYGKMTVGKVAEVLLDRANKKAK